jgi:hypothetical protein
MSEETQNNVPTATEAEAWAAIMAQWEEAFTGAVQRREDLIIGTENFLFLLMLSYRYARKTYEELGAPYGKSATGVAQWLTDLGAQLWDERDPWPRDPGGPIVGITVINLGEYRDEESNEK